MDRSKFTEEQLKQIDKSRAYWGDRLEQTLRGIEQRGEDGLNKLLKAEYKRVSKEIQDITKNLYLDLYFNGGELSVTRLYEHKRYKHLQKQIEACLKRLGEAETHTIYNALDEAYRETFGAVGELFEKVEGFDFAMLNEKQIEKLVNTKWLGRNYADSVWDNKRTLARKIEESIRNSITLGHSKDKAITQLIALTGNSYYNVERLVRTELMHIINDTADSVAKQAKWMHKQWLTAKDERTCETCKLLEDEVFPVDAEIYSHAMCRCTFIYIKDYNG